MRRPVPIRTRNGSVIWRRRLVAILALTASVVAGYQLWLRDSALVAVRHVSVVGASGPDAARIDAALDAAGREMTTLNVREEVLREAVRPFPLVATVRAEAGFPNELTVHVIQRRAAAVLTLKGRWVAVSEDAVLLRGVGAAGLPKISLDATGGGAKLTGYARQAALALGAAPEPLRRHLERASAGEDGIVVQLRDGPELVFGDASRALAKWAAAARLLAEPGLEGMAYIDLRTPERPAAGGVQAGLQAPEGP